MNQLDANRQISILDLKVSSADIRCIERKSLFQSIMSVNAKDFGDNDNFLVKWYNLILFLSKKVALQSLVGMIVHFAAGPPPAPPAGK